MTEDEKPLAEEEVKPPIDRQALLVEIVEWQRLFTVILERMAMVIKLRNPEKWSILSEDISRIYNMSWRYDIRERVHAVMSEIAEAARVEKGGK